MQAGSYTKIVGQCNIYLYCVAVKNLLIVNVYQWLHSTTNKQTEHYNQCGTIPEQMTLVSVIINETIQITQYFTKQLF